MWFILLQDRFYNVLDARIFNGPTAWIDILNFFDEKHNCEYFQIREARSNLGRTRSYNAILKLSHSKLVNFIDDNSILVGSSKNYKKLLKAGDLCKFTGRHGIRFLQSSTNSHIEYVATDDIINSVIILTNDPVINLAKYSTTWSVVGFIPAMGNCFIDCEDLTLI